MGRLIVILIGLLWAGAAQALCPTTRTDCPSPTYNVVLGGTATSNAALKAVTGMTAGTTVSRSGFTTAGDGGAAIYTWSPTSCSLNAGAGDNGSQVAPTVGTGCWLASFPPGGVSPQVWGAVGNGAADDTVNLQNAINGAIAAGVPLLFDSVHLYNITATLNITSPIKIVGPFRYGVWAVNQPTGSGPRNCPWGILNKATGITMINASAITGVIDGLCLDTTGNDATQAPSGAAIKLAPPSSTTYQSGWRVENNTILNPYDGITVDGSGGGTVLGVGGSADPMIVSQNTVTNPLDIGISVGRNTASATEAGVTLRDNAVVCGAFGLTGGLAGVAVWDGDVTYDGTQNGPVGPCSYGLMITPSSVGGVAQFVGGTFRGQLGDQQTIAGLYIKPGNLGHIDYLSVEDQAWAAARTSSGTAVSVVIDCTTTGSACNEISIVGLVSHAGSGTTAIVQVNAGYGGPDDFTLSNSTLCSAATPAAGSSALILNITQGAFPTPPGHYIIANNRIGAGCHGQGMPFGITLNLTGTPTIPFGDTIITGNDTSGSVQGINYTPASTDHVIISNNLGIDEEVGSIASSTAITLPSQNTTAAITGTTPVTTINGAWWSRSFTLIPTSGGLAFNTGGNLCNAVTSVGQVPISLFWNGGESCWNLK
jgi:hypothetical protein